jgi:alpha-galactosidase
LKLERDEAGGLQMKKFVGICCVAAALMAGKVIARGQSQLAAAPPMGWNSWLHYHGKIDDAAVRAQAEALVSTGMRDEGYIYVTIDDTWEGERMPRATFM